MRRSANRAPPCLQAITRARGGCRPSIAARPSRNTGNSFPSTDRKFFTYIVYGFRVYSSFRDSHFDIQN
ncbi:hypothetical protein EMIT0111MI5_10484 [Burkholderia sp. IT-111MI5]